MVAGRRELTVALVAFSPAVLVALKVTPSVERSILKPCSELLVSVHVTLTEVAVSGTAEGFSGADGGGSVVAETTSDQGELPSESYDRTRYQYWVPA